MTILFYNKPAAQIIFLYLTQGLVFTGILDFVNKVLSEIQIFYRRGPGPDEFSTALNRSFSEDFFLSFSECCEQFLLVHPPSDGKNQVFSSRKQVKSHKEVTSAIKINNHIKDRVPGVMLL